MKLIIRLCFGVILGVSVSTNSWSAGRLQSDRGTTLPPNTGVIHAVRAKKPPVLDGKIDDACYQRAKAVTGFLIRETSTPAAYQSSGYVCYDDSNLYIAMKCLLPPGVKPVGEARPGYDASIWSDEVVEIMIDPGATRRDYFQLAVNAYGAKYDSARHTSGAGEDAAEDADWNGDWSARTFISDGYWSVELAIPFHTLGVTRQSGSTWGINLCREAAIHNHFELSSIATNGVFNVPDSFVRLDDLRADFSKYSFQIGPYITTLDASATPPKLTLNMPVRNETGKTVTVRIDRFVDTGGGKEATESSTHTLRSGETAVLFLETQETSPVVEPGRIFYYSRLPNTRKILVADAVSGESLSNFAVTKPAVHQAMALEVENPWHKEMTGLATSAVSLKVAVDLLDAQRQAGTLEVSLVSTESGKVVATRNIPGPSTLNSLRFSARGLPWGAYESRADFKNAGGCTLLSVQSPVVLIPGGKHRIKMLNNFVIELMNARERGLLNQHETEFMNPRDGWCYFQMSGEGQVNLDGIETPILPVKVWGNPNEAMRYLKAGRHTLKVIGAGSGRLRQLLVRAIPALQYCLYEGNPHVEEYGPYFDWDFLTKYVLPDVNVMISQGKPVEEHIKAWKESGRSWLGAASNYREPFDPTTEEAVEKVYKHWSENIGYQHPLMDGVIVDEFGSSDEPVYDVYRKAVERLNVNFKGRAFLPYCGGVTYLWGPDKSRRFGLAAIAGGGYVCQEHYLMEQPTGESALSREINQRMVQFFSRREKEVPGMNPYIVMVLSYNSTPPESLNVYPTANFKVFMDMQMRTLATHQAFFGLGGLQWYNCTYADEENLRWAGRLFRHYCIEGRTGPVTRDPYLLTYVKNPDFVEDTLGWNIQPAEKDSIRTNRYVGYGHLQSRYMYRADVGDTFLATRRSGNKPNVFGQTIVDLEPGRLYSLKMITCDYQDLVKEISSKKSHGISIKIDNVEMLTGAKNSFDHNLPGGYWQGLGKFKRNYLCWMKYYWRVFRARATTAELSISDWLSPNEPGGTIGQEIMYNFIEIQPYFEE